jgi:hypothetical protein
MKPFNADEIFEPILADIESGNIKTTHSLRLILENLSGQFNIKALLILEMFRKWLLKRGIELSTEYGVVGVSRVGTRG